MALERLRFSAARNGFHAERALRGVVAWLCILPYLDVCTYILEGRARVTPLNE